MKKLIATFLILISMSSFGQSDLVFYHLGASTPQSSMNNVSFFPDAECYFSLPALSGVNMKFNNGFTYNQLMVPVANTDSMQVDLRGVLDHLKEGDNLRLNGDVSLFQFGVRAGDKAFTLSYNLRYAGGVTYPVQFLNYFVYGNGDFIGERVEEKDIQGGGISYSEIGLGYSQELAIADKWLRVGGRLKYLQGIAHVSSAKDASITMFTESDSYDLSVTFNNATFRTAGLNEVQGDDPTSYLVGFGANKNTGFAIDLGAEMQINELFTGYFAVNDLGFINWKQDVENYTLTTDAIMLNGFDNLDDIDLSEALEDSLDAWSERETDSVSFRTGIGSRVLLGASYLVLENGRISGSISWNRSSYRASEFGVGVGYTHQFGRMLTLSTTVLKEQNRPFKLGGAFATRLGLIQLYGAVDDILNVVRDPADIHGLDARIGLNFLIGRSNTGKRAERPPKEELSPFPPEYDLDHLLDTEEGEDN